MSADMNIWQLAEAHLNGALSEQEKNILAERMATDPVFESSFQECLNLITALQKNGKTKKFRAMLRDVHQELDRAQKSRTGKRRRIIPPNTWRTAAVAAGVALITSLASYLTLHKPSEKSSFYKQLANHGRAINDLRSKQIEQDKKINKIQDSLDHGPSAEISSTGTGFALTNNGYFVTNYHVVKDADSIYIRTRKNKYYKAHTIAYDDNRDIALMKIEKKNFRFSRTDVPYTLQQSRAALGLRIYTIGFPQQDIVYHEGYISSRNGFNGDSNQYRLNLPADPGQSGAPVLNEQGNVIAIVTASESERESTTYAVSTIALHKLLHSIPRQIDLHLPQAGKLSRLNREQQLERLQDYTFVVQVYKK